MVWNRFATLKNLDADAEINTVLEAIRNIEISAQICLGYYELKKHGPWFNVRCSKLLDKGVKQIAVVAKFK
jgi:hypothetical protein